MRQIHLVTAATAALLLGAAQGAAAQTPASTTTAKTQATAVQATGKATTDGPANTSVQGMAAAMKQGAAPVTAGAQAGVSASATASLAKPVVAAGDLVETAKASGQFTTFLKGIDATNLTAVLKNNKNLTVFVPTDAAFAALPAGALDRLMADKAGLQKLLTHHVINASVDSSKIAGKKGPVTSVANDAIELDGSEDGRLMADGATIIQADVRATNGILHVIDKVMMPGAAGATTAAAPASATAPAASVSAPAMGTKPKAQQ